MPQEKMYTVTSCRPWRILWRMLLVWALALAAVLILVISEQAALGEVVHGRLAGNMAALLALAGLVDGTVTLFRAGWFRFNNSGYGVHIPWNGSRAGGQWEHVNFIGLVPGSTVGARFDVMVLIVDARGKARAMEYRQGLVEKLLALCPSLRIAALVENRKVGDICRKLDEEGIGWLPLSWVQHIDGSGELVLRSPAPLQETSQGMNSQPASQEAPFNG